MPDSGCTLTINGDDYYYPCDKSEDLQVINGYLINVGSSTITLYQNFPEQGVTGSGYPRITCPSNTKAYLRTTSSSNYSTVTVSSFVINNKRIENSYLLSILILGVLVCQLFRR